MQAPEFNLNRSLWHLRYKFSFICEGSKAEIFTERSHNPEERRGKISDLVSQYFQRYDLYKLGLFQGPEFHLKEVIVGKSS